MSTRKPRRRSRCPINYSLELFGDRWTLLIVRDLMFKGRKYYGDFLDAGEGISTNILADRLKRLEENGVISKSADPQNRARVVYALTDKGRDLLPIMLEITRWSGKYDRHTNAPRALLEELEKNQARVTPSIRKQL